MKNAVGFTVALLVSIVIGLGLLVENFHQKQSALQEERQQLEEVLKNELMLEERTQGEFLLHLTRDFLPPNSYAEYTGGKKSFAEIFTHVQHEIAGRAPQLEQQVERIGRSVSGTNWLIDTLMCDRRLLTHDQLMEYRNFFSSFNKVEDLCTKNPNSAPCTGSDYRPVWGVSH